MLNKKTVCKLLVGCFCLSLCSIALADESARPPMPPCGPCAPHDRPDPAAMEQHLEKQLQKLVEQNTITTKQSAKLNAFFKEKAAQRKEDMEKMKDMSPEQRDVYLQEKFKQHPDMIGELKDAAGLSDETAKIVADALRPPHRPDFDIEKRISACLAKLASENTITQAEADKITDFFKQKAAEHKAEMEKVKNMSQSERNAFFKDKMSHHPDLLNDLKTAIGLSDEAAKLVADALRPPHHPGPECPQPPMNEAP